MAWKVDDQVRETSTTAGVGTYSLDGAATGFQAFSVLGNGTLTGYMASDGVNFEGGIGTVGTGPNTLARTAVISSSNGDAAVNWGAGTRTIRCVELAVFSPRQPVESRSANTILGHADWGKTIVITANTFSQTLSAAATLADGWRCKYKNLGTGTVTLDPNGAETINGAATLALKPGQGGEIWCNGVAFFMVVSSSDETNIYLGGNITLAAATAKIIAGATSLAFRNNADSADNLLLTDAGALTVRAGVTISSGGLTVNAGNIAIGTTIDPAVGVRINSSLTTSANQYGMLSSPTVSNAATEGWGVGAQVVTAAAAFTLTNARAFQAINASKGAGSAITNNYGFECVDISAGGTLNAGFKGGVTSGAGKYNLYLDGSAQNYIAGKTGIGTTPNANIGVIVVNLGVSQAAIQGQNDDQPSATARLVNGATSGNNMLMEFYTDGGPTIRGTIDYNRGGGLLRYNTTSDMSLKTLLGDASQDRSLEILRGTRLREFYWNSDPTKKPQIGPFAQELGRLYKGAVSGGWSVSSNGTMSYSPMGVDKTAHTWHLVAGWQNHEARLARVEQQLALTH